MRAFLLALLSSPVVAFSVTLNWDALPANSGVVGYDIHYGPVAATPSTHVTVGNVVTAVIPATGTNYYTVTGRDSTGKISKPSNQVMWPAVAPSPTPSPPQLGFSLAWNAVANANSYRIFENNAQIAEITALTYSLAGKVGPKTYTVRSVGVSGQSAPSNSVTLAAPTPSPSPSPTPTPVPVPAAPVLQLQQS